MALWYNDTGEPYEIIVALVQAPYIEESKPYWVQGLALSDLGLQTPQSCITDTDLMKILRYMIS